MDEEIELTNEEPWRNYDEELPEVDEVEWQEWLNQEDEDTLRY